MDKPLLLVVDDVKMNRMVIRKFLSNEYDVREAADGQEALDMLHADKYDALLLDIIMPKVDGMEVLQQLRSDSSYDSMSILVATSTKEKTERPALEAGADDIVGKPYDPIVIKQRLENIRAKKELQALRAADSPVANKEGLSNAASKATRIQKTAELLTQNSENCKLTVEFARQIAEQAQDLLTILGQMKGNSNNE